MAIRITIVEQLCKELLSACHLQFSSLEVCAQELVDIITSIALANSSNPPSLQEPTQNLSSNLLWPTRLVITLAKASSWLQVSDAQPNIPPTAKVFSLPNTPSLTTLTSGPVIGLLLGDLLTLETLPAKALPRAQRSVPKPNFLVILEALPLPNEFQSTTLADILVSSSLPPGDPPPPEATLARTLPWAQPSGGQPNISATLEALPLLNEA